MYSLQSEDSMRKTCSLSGQKDVAFLQDHEARELFQRRFFSVKSPEKEGSKHLGLEHSKGN